MMISFTNRNPSFYSKICKSSSVRSISTKRISNVLAGSRGIQLVHEDHRSAPFSRSHELKVNGFATVAFQLNKYTDDDYDIDLITLTKRLKKRPGRDRRWCRSPSPDSMDNDSKNTLKYLRRRQRRTNQTENKESINTKFSELERIRSELPRMESIEDLKYLSGEEKDLLITYLFKSNLKSNYFFLLRCFNDQLSGFRRFSGVENISDLNPIDFGRMFHEYYNKLSHLGLGSTIDLIEFKVIGDSITSKLEGIDLYGEEEIAQYFKKTGEYDGIRLLVKDFEYGFLEGRYSFLGTQDAQKEHQSTQEEPASSSDIAGEYIQLPDNVHLEQYTSELINLKSLLTAKGYQTFGDLQPSQVLELLQEGISDGTLVTNDPNFALSYQKLLVNLKSLFRKNGGYTFILDTLLNSQSVFVEFEREMEIRGLKAKVQAFLPNYSKELKNFKDYLDGENISIAKLQDSELLSEIFTFSILVPANERLRELLDDLEIAREVPNIASIIGKFLEDENKSPLHGEEIDEFGIHRYSKNDSIKLSQEQQYEILNNYFFGIGVPNYQLSYVDESSFHAYKHPMKEVIREYFNLTPSAEWRSDNYYQDIVRGLSSDCYYGLFEEFKTFDPIMVTNFKNYLNKRLEQSLPALVQLAIESHPSIPVLSSEYYSHLVNLGSVVKSTGVDFSDTSMAVKQIKKVVEDARVGKIKTISPSEVLSCYILMEQLERITKHSPDITLDKLFFTRRIRADPSLIKYSFNEVEENIVLPHFQLLDKFVRDNCEKDSSFGSDASEFLNLWEEFPASELFEDKYWNSQRSVQKSILEAHDRDKLVSKIVSLTKKFQYLGDISPAFVEFDEGKVTDADYRMLGNDYLNEVVNNFVNGGTITGFELSQVINVLVEVLPFCWNAAPYHEQEHENSLDTALASLLPHLCEDPGRYVSFKTLVGEPDSSWSSDWDSTDTQDLGYKFTQTKDALATMSEKYNSKVTEKLADTPLEEGPALTERDSIAVPTQDLDDGSKFNFDDFKWSSNKITPETKATYRTNFDSLGAEEENAPPQFNNDGNVIELFESLNRLRSTSDKTNTRLERIEDLMNVLETELKASKSFRSKELASDSEIEQLEKLNPEEIRRNYHSSSASEYEEPKIDDIKNFLMDAKKQKDSDKESLFREQNAYEWSKNRASAAPRSFETNNFFNPIDGKNTKEANDLFFPSFSKPDIEREYLLYPISAKHGKSIVSRQNPLGENHVVKDMFSIFGKLEYDPEVLLGIVKKLEKKDWRLIDSGNDSILVFDRPIGGNKRGGFFKKVTNIFATVGAVCVGLVGFNFLYDEPSIVVHISGEEDHRTPAVNSQSEEVEGGSAESEKQIEVTSAVLHEDTTNVVTSVVDTSESDAEKKQNGYLSGLFWSRKD